MSLENAQAPSASLLADRYRELFGTAPEGVWSAPGRVNLIGEHTDYNAGLVLPIAIPQRAVVACSARSDSLLRLHSVHIGETVEVRLEDVAAGMTPSWAGYLAGVLWALAARGHTVRGMDVYLDSSVPVGAGLSSSAAVECAIGAAASDLFGLGLVQTDSGRADLAAACVASENEISGVPTGGMDQSASLLCHQGQALLLDCRDGSTRHIPVAAMTEAHAVTFLVTNTRAAHALVDSPYAERFAACRRAARILQIESLREVNPENLGAVLAALPDDVTRRRTRHVVTEIERVRTAVAAVAANDPVLFGGVLDQSHRSLRDDFEVSVPELDVAVESAVGAGALGARMTGGGFGGSTVALVPVDRIPAVAQAISENFARHGWAAPQSFCVDPSDGARRDVAHERAASQ